VAHPLSAYLALIDALAAAGWKLHPIRDAFAAPASPPSAYLRHDVDRRPDRALTMAEAEARRGIRASYYFRCDARGRFPARVMQRIAGLGHEPGFHYECLSRCRGDQDAALARFEHELALCRRIVPVETVAPHGAPLSAASNMDFAAGIGPERFGLLGDATGLDLSNSLYVTDTGGTFGSRHNLRDRSGGPMLAAPVHPRRLAAHLIDSGATRVVLSCHPERWPAGRLGLLQAAARDLATNAAKRLIRTVR